MASNGGSLVNEAVRGGARGRGQSGTSQLREGDPTGSRAAGPRPCRKPPDDRISAALGAHVHARTFVFPQLAYRRHGKHRIVLIVGKELNYTEVFVFGFFFFSFLSFFGLHWLFPVPSS